MSTFAPVRRPRRHNYTPLSAAEIAFLNLRQGPSASADRQLVAEVVGEARAEFVAAQRKKTEAGGRE
jgi:hypothetical protein